MLRSQLCSAESLRSAELRAWADRLRPMWASGSEDGRDVMLHRKMWEWLFIAEALRERGLLAPGRAGLGFGVGQEPLVALFAAEGCDLVATDQPHDAAVASGWTTSEVEWAGGLEQLNTHGLCPDEAVRAPGPFSSRRHERDPRRPAWLRLHLVVLRPRAPGHAGRRGGLRRGADGVPRAGRGGRAHDRVPRVAPATRRWRRAGPCSTGAVTSRRWWTGCTAPGMESTSTSRLGTTPEDLHVDVPPYTDVHLRTRLGDYETTSLALVITKRSGGRGRVRPLRRRSSRG